MYRLAIREGHATEDFSAVYESAIGNTDNHPEIDSTSGNVIRSLGGAPARIAA
jgi:hypothetical protein